MTELETYLNQIDPPEHQERMREIHDWVSREFPQLVIQMKWNQPMYTDHETYIIAFSTAKKHLSFAPEKAAMDQFSKEIAEAGYSCSKMLVSISWTTQVDYDLLRKVIAYNIEDKKEYTKFWR